MKPLFQEKQKYDQWWLWLIIVSTSVVVIGLFVHGLVVQLYLGEPWGDNPMTDDVLIANSLIVITVMVVMLLIFFNSVLEVVVDRNSVSYRYFPLIRTWKRVERETMQGFATKTYWNGYGVKRDLRGNRSVTVKGHAAVEITMLDGKTLLIGTQKAGEFLDALNRMKKGSVD